MSAYRRLEGDALQRLADVGIDPAVVQGVIADPMGWGLEEYAAEVGSSDDVALAMLGCAEGWAEDALDELGGPGADLDHLAALEPLLRAAIREWFTGAVRRMEGAQ